MKMNNRLFFLGGLIALLAGSVAQAADWQLVWSDEFDKPGLPDPAKWTYEEGFVRNNELQPHYLILNSAVGGAWGGAQGVDSSIFPQKFLLDYVRVYEQKGAVK
jgi:beta-glucanase (GH16 family)